MSNLKLIVYAIIFVLISVFGTTFGHHVLSTQKLLSVTKIRLLEQAIQRSIVLWYTKCSLGSFNMTGCTEGNTIVEIKKNVRVRMSYGYPAATQDGILKTLDLQLDSYFFMESGGGLKIRLSEQNSNEACQLSYRFIQHAPEIMVTISGC